MLAQSPTRANYKFVLKDWMPLLELRAASSLLETKRFSQNLRPFCIECPEAQRVLVLAPHVDDDVFGPGGTLIKLSGAGAAIKTVYFSATGSTPETSAAIKEEAREASMELAAEAEFLDLTPGAFPIRGTIIEELKNTILAFRPNIIFTTFLLDDHDDHRRVNHMLLAAAGEVDLKVEVWAYQIYSSILPNVVVDITDQVAAKRRLIDLFKSVRGERNWAHYILGMNAANCRFLPGRKAAYVESFFVVPLTEYLDLCRTYFRNPPSELYRNRSYHGIDDEPV